MKKEIEVRYELLNKDVLSDWLNKNAEFLFSTHQVDTYYDNKNSTFINDRSVSHIYDWLRIREEEDKTTLNYKHWLPEGEVIRTYCNEYEVEVSSSNEMKEILKVLGFYKLVTVDKLRESWLYGDVEISIDSVKELGDYVEAEYKGKETGEINVVLDEMKEVLKKIGAVIENEDHEGHAIKLFRKMMK